MGLLGVGKGMQVKLIGEYYGILVILIGDMFCVMKSEDLLFVWQVWVIMEFGGYVSDEIINVIVVNWFVQGDCDYGFLFDGYLWILQQVQIFDEYFEVVGKFFDVVILLVLRWLLRVFFVCWIIIVIILILFCCCCLLCNVIRFGDWFFFFW